MKIDEKALRAAADFAEEQGWAVHDNSDGTYRDDVRNLGTFAKIIGAYFDALPASPEGKLRVRGSVALTGDGAWTLAGYHSWDDERARQEGKFMGKSAQYRWIEADVTPWQPPVEETAQGREIKNEPNGDEGRG